MLAEQSVTEPHSTSWRKTRTFIRQTNSTLVALSVLSLLRRDTGLEPGLVAHIFNPSTWVYKVSPGQPHLCYTEILVSKKKKKKKKEGTQRERERVGDGEG
jgi:hypothetical protein